VLSESCPRTIAVAPTGKARRKTATVLRTFRKEFFKFCESLGEEGEAWKSGSRVFLDEKAIDDYLVIRKQKSGICVLHASVVLQHYVQSLRISNEEDHTHEMLDISKFIRDDFPKEKKTKYIKTGACGLGSEEFFLLITETKKLKKHHFTMKSFEEKIFHFEVEHFLEMYQYLKAPALVSCFRTEKAFHSGTIFDGEVDESKFDKYAKSHGKSEGIYCTQAMVMLGAHKDENTGKVWFLLQNFWENGYFRLVSAEYMASCNATVSFVLDEADVSLKKNFNIVDAEYAETTVQWEECARCCYEDAEDGPTWWCKNDVYLPS